MRDFYSQWAESLESAGIPLLSLDTCCKLLAIVHSCAIEEFVFHQKLSVDIAYAQRRCGVYGSGTPDKDCVRRISALVKEMENAPQVENSDTLWEVQFPQWAVDLMRDRYDIILPKQMIG